jgi:hypothetical protein
MNIDQINALNRFALSQGRGWKDRLFSSWMCGIYPVTTSGEDQCLLQQLRNNGGAELLENFRPREEGFKKVGYFKRDRMERFNLKRGWFVNAWRIVTEAGNDMVQPWDQRKSEAKETADQMGIFILGVLQ